MDPLKTVLYGYYRSSATYRLRMALNLKKVPFEIIPINLLKGEQKGAEYLKVNPQGKVPSLVIDGLTLTESTAIFEYLEETRSSEVSLFPKTAALRVKARELAQVINAGIQPVQNLPVLQEIKKLGGDEKEWAQKVIRTGLKGTKGKFSVGDEISIADICLVPQLYNAARFNIDLATEFPELYAIDAEMQKVSEIAAAHPKNQPDAPEE